MRWNSTWKRVITTISIFAFSYMTLALCSDPALTKSNESALAPNMEVEKVSKTVSPIQMLNVRLGSHTFNSQLGENTRNSYAGEAGLPKTLQSGQAQSRALMSDDFVSPNTTAAESIDCFV